MCIYSVHVLVCIREHLYAFILSLLQAFEGAVKDHINRIQSRRLHRRSMMLPVSSIHVHVHVHVTYNVHANKNALVQVHVNCTFSLPQDSIDGVQDGNSNEGTLGMFAPPWLPDSSVSMCQLCGIHFTVTRRRHHCRACGMV